MSIQPEWRLHSAHGDGWADGSAYSQSASYSHSTLQESMKGLEAVRVCFSAASSHKILTKHQENYIDTIPQKDQNRREIFMGRRESKAQSS